MNLTSKNKKPLPNYITLSIVLIGGVALTIVIFLKFASLALHDLQQRFDQDSFINTEIIFDRYNDVAQSLKSLSSFFEQSKYVSRSAFEYFSTPFFENKSISSVAWLPEVPFEGREAYEAAIREDGGNASFSILERTEKGEYIPSSSKREVYFPFQMIAERDAVDVINEIPGLDLLTIDGAQGAIKTLRARDDHTASLYLKRDSNYSLALIKSVRNTDNISNPRATRIGLLYISFDQKKIIEELPYNTPHASQFNVRVYGTQPNRILGLLASVQSTTADKKDLHSFIYAAFYPQLKAYKRTFPFADILLNVEMVATQTYVVENYSPYFWFILPVGFLIVLVFFGYLRRLLYQKQTAESIAEEQAVSIKRREGYLTTMFRSIADALIITDEHGCIILMNPTAEVLIGLSLNDIRGKSFFETVRLIDAATLKPGADIVSRILTSLTQEESEYETLMLRPKGDERIVSINASAIKDNTQKEIGVVLLIRDITKERTAQKALNDSEQKFRSFYSSMNEGAAMHRIIYDTENQALNYIIVDVNPRYEMILNTTRESVIGHLATEVYGTTSAPYLDIYARVAATGEPVSNTIYFEPVKKFFHVSVFSYEKGTFATVFMDITEQRHQETALRQSHDKNMSILRAAPTGIGVVQQRMFLEVNDRFCEIIGYDRSELLNKSSRMIYPDEEEFKRVGRELYGSISHEGLSSIETQLLHKDGMIVDALLNITPLDLAHPEEGSIFTILDITDMKTAERDLTSARNFYLKVLDDAPPLIWRANIEGAFDWFNQSWHSFTGKSLGEDSGDGWFQNVHVDDVRSCSEIYHTAFNDRKAFKMEYRLRRHDGVYRWVVDLGRPLFTDNDTFAGYIGYCFDITDRKIAEELLLKEKNLLRTLIDNLPDSIYVKDAQGRKILTNTADMDFIGISDEVDVIGKTDAELFPGPTAERFINDDQNVIRNGEMVINREELVENARGDKHWLLTSKLPLRDPSGEILGLIGIGRDITDRKMLENKLIDMAHFDTLTALPNRTLFFERAHANLLQAKRSKLFCAMLFIDLDHFKKVNDTLGHSIGDELIKDAASRLNECIRESDILARLGGDEFVIFLNAMEGIDNARVIAERIIEKFNSSRMVMGNDLFITASIGITVAPDDGYNLEELLKNADTAMYAAKESGRNSYCFFNAEMNQKAVTRMQVERGLRDALTKGEFVLYYQPIVSPKTGRLRGFEALIRWFRSEGGLIFPNEFIPIAEETGLIIPIGEWVIQHACMFNKQLLDAGFGELIISVNISVAQLRRRNIIDTLKNALLESGLPATCLEIEVTESVLIESFDATHEFLTEVRGLGIKVALDDFGSGYSSLSYLQKLPIDSLKIDRQFIKEITQEKEENDLTPAIIDLAHKLGLKVIAEGVESELQLDRLARNDCDYFQGFLLSKPMAEAAVLGFLREHYERFDQRSQQ